MNVSLPSASIARTRQEFTTFLFMMSAQLPHSPRLQPSLVFISFSLSRSVSSSVSQGSTWRVYRSPFTFSSICRFISKSSRLGIVHSL